MTFNVGGQLSYSCSMTNHLFIIKRIQSLIPTGIFMLHGIVIFIGLVDAKIEDLNELDNKGDRLKISYVRVSSINQKDDLERQKKLIKDAYPNHIMIEDIGSGINLNKRGIRKIIKLAIEGKIEELVVAYKDRLTRFGYELIEDLIKEYSRGKIVILNQKDDLEPEEELAFDVLQIMNVFVAKMNGLRKYKKNNDNKSKKDINKKIEKKSKM